MRLVSRPRALHIKNIQMPSPPGRRKRGREGLRVSTATRVRIYGLHGAIVQIMFMKQCSGRRPPFSSSRRSYTQRSCLLCVYAHAVCVGYCRVAVLVLHIG